MQTDTKVTGNSSSEYKARIIKVGTMIYERYLSELGSARLNKLLARPAANTIHRGWLVRQFEHLADENEGDFDYTENWNALRLEEDNLYEVLYQFRLLFVTITAFKTN